MPEALSEQEKTTIISPAQDWSESYARKIFLADYQKADQHYQQNLSQRNVRAMELYLAITGKKKWRGTNVPRASVPVWMGVEQIQSLLPNVIDALTQNGLDFEVQSRPGTPLAAAYAV